MRRAAPRNEGGRTCEIVFIHPRALYVARAGTDTKRKTPVDGDRPHAKHRVRFHGGISGSPCTFELHPERPRVSLRAERGRERRRWEGEDGRKKIYKLCGHAVASNLRDISPNRDRERTRVRSHCASSSASSLTRELRLCRNSIVFRFVRFCGFFARHIESRRDLSYTYRKQIICIERYNERYSHFFVAYY